jgi:predicted CXXCH cytochrome family protein
MALAGTIVGSKHDLSVSNNGTNSFAAAAGGTDEICVYCHTPHDALQTRVLWQKVLSTVNMTWDETATKEGTPLPTTAITAATARCSSCHDGVATVGTVNNAPNSGLSMDGALTNIAGNAIVGVGGDFSGTHPIGIPYAGTTGSSASATGADGGYYAATGTGCTSPSGFCTDEATNGAAINLQGTVVTDLTVECSTCHEPHNVNGIAQFLVVDNATQSNLCRSCHNK